MIGIRILLDFTLNVQIMLISYEILYFPFNYRIMTVWEEKQKVMKKFSLQNSLSNPVSDYKLQIYNFTQM